LPQTNFESSGSLLPFNETGCVPQPSQHAVPERSTQSEAEKHCVRSVAPKSTTAQRPV
jgi:hypothetical protein